jgi:histidine triad (HIT) family protein
MGDCIFCKIISGDIPCVKIHENSQVLAFADINPIDTGHVLIIPKAHYENIWEIPPAELAAVAQASKIVAAAIQAALTPDGVAVLQLNGRGVNQVVMHYHMHLIPRSAGSQALSMTAWELVPGDMDQIKGTAQKIAAAIAAQ